MVLGLSLTWLAVAARAQDNSALSICLGLTNQTDEIHNCLDNQLDAMDGEMEELTGYVRKVLNGEALASFNRSQQSFAIHRQENCRWYQFITEPRSVADQVAKNCLAGMTQARLAELRRLISGVAESSLTLRGHLLDTGSRRLFQACRSSEVYQLSGDAATLAAVREYLAKRANSVSGPLQVVMQGVLEPNRELDRRLAGTLRVRAFSEVTERDVEICPPPANTLDLDKPKDISATTPSSDGAEQAGNAVNSEVEAQAEPPSLANESATDGEQLLAYFGAWQADCREQADGRYCLLSTRLQPDSSRQSESPAALTLRRFGVDDMTISAFFPQREVDSPSRFRWRVDSRALGDIIGSSIRVDESGTRQEIDNSRAVRRDILPLFINGREVGIEVVASVDDARGEAYRATLIGLTRALDFADNYVN